MPKSRHDVWSARMARYHDCNLTVAEFCRREGVSVPSFYQWKKKLSEGAKEAPPAFLPIEIKSSAGSVTAAKLTLPGGATMELGESLSDASLRRILRAVLDVTDAEQV